MTVEQRRAAAPGVSVWVAASAGTGKTQVLTNRVLALLLAGTPPGRILCLTFTRAAAAEMSFRIKNRLGRWATMADDLLHGEITGLAGGAPDAAALQAARRLFARVLDEPGGMKIQTIHAFCQSVLRRFPLEAGLAPHFTVMDERDAAELMADARRQLLAGARRQGGAREAALAVLTVRLAEDDFGRLLGELTRDRARLRRIAAAARAGSGATGSLVEGVRGWLDLPSGETAEDARAAACLDAAFDGEALRRAAATLAGGSAGDRKRATAMAGWLAAPDRRAAGLDDYLRVFLTGKDEPRKALATKAVLAAAPGIDDDLAREAARLLALVFRLRAHVVAGSTAAALQLGIALLELYDRNKAARALVDYDDLILACRDLLREDGAAWVLYKLDGGIDHVLIDEAQDTNPEQWEVVRALTGEFFAGEGSRGAPAGPPRTVFAVGDPKQSIYSFQRAAPEMFAEMRDFFAGQAADAACPWRDVPLDRSFRSTAPVLDLVDAVFAGDPAREGVVSGDTPLEHAVDRSRDAGLVELWPPVALDETGTGDAEGWILPLEQRPVRSPQSRLAGAIAGRIRRWLDDGEWLAPKGRPLVAQDIMILLPRRTAFMDEMIAALKQRNVPVAGADRMVLTEQLAVMDLLALARFLLLPDDDLSLATVLRSPLAGLGEEQLFALAHGREGSLWRALGAAARRDRLLAAVRDMLAGLLARADLVRPYELFADLLGPGGGRRRIRARLGPEADDPLDEFLALALTFERSHVPSLEGFLHWVRAGEARIRRDLEQGVRDEIRVMTVHGAKGLQAPVVFLPDTMVTPAGLPADRVLWPAGEDRGYWVPRREYEVPETAAVRQITAAARDREYRRLLYVAMTRAADRLYICGFHGKRQPAPDCWHRMVEAGFRALGDGVGEIDLAAETGGAIAGTGLRYEAPQLGKVAGARTVSDRDREPLPDWAGDPAPAEPAPSAPLAPSRPTRAEPPVRSPLSVDAAGRGNEFRRGLIIHRLLEILPEMPEGRRRQTGAGWLERTAADMAPDQRGRILDEVLAITEDPAFAALFGPGSLAEVPLAGVIDGPDGPVTVSGRVDRLLVTDRVVTVVDYKSGRVPPDDAARIPAAWGAQMAAYRALLAGIWPGREIRCALLWTAVPLLTIVDPDPPGAAPPAGG